MKNVILLTLTVVTFSFAAMGQTLYWDTDGATPGPGIGSGSWDADTFWSASANGDLATGPWIEGATAIFSAGTAYTFAWLTVTGAVSVSGITVEEGELNLSGGTVVLTNNPAINVADTGAATPATITSVLAGTNGFAKTGAGLLRLDQANIYTGTIRINQGTLSVQGDNRMGSVPAVPTPDAIVLDGGTLQTTPGGTLNLNANRGIFLGPGSATIETFVSGGTLNVQGLVSGAAPLAKKGGGTLTLRGDNTFSGGIDFYEGRLNPNDSINALGTGTLRVRSTITPGPMLLGGNGFGINNPIVLDPGTTLQLVLGTAMSFGGPISGEGSLLRNNNGAGTPTLPVANTFTGGLLLAARSLAVADARALGTGTLTLGDPFTPPNNAINLVAGADLTGVSALTNAVVVNQDFTLGGTFDLQFTSPFSLGLATRTITVSGGGTTKTLSGILSADPGVGLIKAGPDTLALTAANTYDGGTLINAGTLLANNTTGSATGPGQVAVNAGGILGGTGNISGSVALTNGSVSPGVSVGKLTLQNGADFSAGGSCVWELNALKDDTTGTPGVDFDQLSLTGGNLVAGPSTILLINFTGTAGTPDTNQAFWTQPHQWTIVSLSGAAANPGATKFDILNYVAATGAFTNTVAPNGNIVLRFDPTATPPPIVETLYWDANGTNAGAANTNDLTVSGTWGADLFWNDSAEGTNETGIWVDGKTAVFSAGTDGTIASTVTIVGSQVAKSLRFEEGAITLTGGSISLQGSTNGEAEIWVEEFATPTSTTALAGTNDVVKTGSGEFYLGNTANTFSGRTILRAGSWAHNGDNRFGAIPAEFDPDNIILDGGTFRCYATGNPGLNLNANRGIWITSNNGTINESAANTTGALTVNGVISGAGKLTKIGPARLRLENANTFSGGIDLNEGTLAFDATAAAGTGVIHVNAGLPTIIRTMNGTTGLTVTITNSIVLASGASPTFGPGGSGAGADLEFAGVISGQGGIVRADVGDKHLIFSGANTYSGGFTITQRRVVPGNKLAFGTGLITIGDPFYVPGSADYIFFLPAVDLTGASAITNSVLVYQQFSMSLPAYPQNLEFSGPVELANPDIPIYANTVGLTHRLSGLVSSAFGYGFIKQGAGTLVLSSPNTYGTNGTTQILEGTLAVNNVTGSGTGGSAVSLATPGANLVGTGAIAGLVVIQSGSISGGPGLTNVGKLTLQNGLDMSVGGTNVWELGALKDDSTGLAGVDFDQISLTAGTLNLSGATLQIGFTAAGTSPNPANAFWQTAHTWTIVGLSGIASNPGSLNFAAIANGTNAAGYFLTSVAPNGSVKLSFTPAPIAPPVIQSLGASPTSFMLSWNSLSGYTYVVEYKTNLAQPDWQLLTSLLGTGGLLSVTNDHGGEAMRFYRLGFTP